MRLYVTFDNDGFIEGLFNSDLTPIPQDKEVFLLTERLRDEIANYPIGSKVKVDNLSANMDITYDDISLLLKDNPNPNIVVVEEMVDQEKLAMAEAIADLYEQLLILQGGA